jgi:DNA repair photolyase
MTHKVERIRGRGSSENPPNRFERTFHVVEPDVWAPDPDDEAETTAPATELLVDRSRSLIATNDSPDIGFEASINPYRGCEHGCSYCYARPFHEYLGFSAGLDFETKILVKLDAPTLLRRELASPRWVPMVLALSGVTDAYQPVERRLRITRKCLEVLVGARNPVAVVTKSQLVRRDADLLSELARHQAASVCVSITTLDSLLARRMEPRASLPRQRLEAIQALAGAGVPVGVLVSPVIPGLTEHEIPAILSAAAAAGATFAGHLMLRLPGAVAGVFENWLEEHYPARKAKVLERIRTMRGGRLNDARFGKRMRGEGPLADMTSNLFRAARERAGLSTGGPPLSTTSFRRPTLGGQLTLFD